MGLVTVSIGLDADGPGRRHYTEGISVGVFQTRADVPQRRLEISITNETEVAVVVTGARSDSSQFVVPADCRPEHPGPDYWLDARRNPDYARRSTRTSWRSAAWRVRGARKS